MKPIKEPSNNATTTSTTNNTTTHQLSKINDPIGDILVPTKPPHTIRLYFQNIRGASSNNWINWEGATRYLAEHQTDIIGYAETNIAWTQPQRSKANTISKKYNQQTAMHTSTSNDTPISNYQPGGVASIIQGKWTGRIIERFQDNSGMGRWTGFCLQGKQNTKVSVFTAYRAVKTQGPTTTYMQQWRTIRQQQKHNTTKPPDPRAQMLTDLGHDINNRRRQNHDIILMWDANESTEHPTSSITNFSNLTGLLSLHPILPPSSYNRGSRCIDYIMGTANIQTAVSSQGYLPFYDGAWTSDHRPLFVDLNATLLFKANTDTLLPTPTRHISSNNGKQMKLFIEYLRQNINILNDLNTSLENIASTNTLTPTDASLLEAHDKAFTALLLQAENAAKTKYHDPWHPKLHQAFLIWQYWKRTASKNATQHNTNKQLEDIVSKIDPQADIYMQDKDRPPHYQLKKATKILNELRKHATKLRYEHLTLRHEIMVLNGQQSQAKAIASIAKAEQRRRCYQKIRQFTKPTNQSGGLTHVILTDSDNNTHKIHDKEDLFRILHERNQQHFAQADGTPFTRPPLTSLLRYSGVTEFGEDILKGKINKDTNPEIQQHVLRIIQELKRVRNPIAHTVPFKDMIEGFHKWKESTSTSPSNKHLGIYRALTTYHRLSENKNNNSATKMYDTTATIALLVQHKLINIAIKFSYSYERWYTIHNFFIEKIPGKPLLEKLRVIHLYEADWNFILKYFLAHKITKLGYQEQTFTSEQVGGRPGMSASDMATHTTLLHAICFMQLLIGAILYFDAAACFDRQIENFTNLACMREGLPTQIATLHAQTLQKARYHIRTKHGISPIPNTHSTKHPFHGSGQGAGDSMTRWSLASDAIIRTYNKYSHPVAIHAPISKITYTEKMKAFVDDSHSILINDGTTTFTTTQLVEHNAQLWENLLNAIGGKLEINKSRCLIFGNSQDNHPPNNPIIYDSESKKPIEIPQMNHHEAYKLLGVHLAFDGNHKAQLQHIQTKCSMLARTFQYCHLSQIDTMQGYRMNYLPALRYGLSATTIPPKLLRQAQKQVTHAVLPKLGYNQHTPRAIAYAPTHFGGIGLTDLATEQGTAHVLFIIGHIRANTKIATTIYIALETYCIITGITTNPLMNISKIRYCNSPWIDITRDFLQLTKTRINLPQLQTPQKIRTHDIALMHPSHTSQETTTNLRTINHCRIYLQVTTLAEISTSDGTSILPSALFGTTNRSTNQPELWDVTTSLLKWPKYKEPTPQEWKLWTKHLRRFTKPDNLRLKQSLGAWSPTHSKHRHWTYSINSNQTLIKQNSPHPEPNHLFNLRQHQQKRTISVFERAETKPNNNPLHSPNWTPATPHELTETTITLKNPKINPVDNPNNNEHNQRQPPIDNTLITPPDATVHIRCETKHLGTNYKYSWAIGTCKSNIISGTCHEQKQYHTNEMRPQLLGLIKALQTKIQTTTGHLNPASTKIHLWVTSNKTKSTISKFRLQNNTATNATQDEYHLLQQLHTLLNQYSITNVTHWEPNIKTPKQSMAYTLHYHCQDKLARQPTNRNDAPLQTANAATLIHHNHEITSSIKTTLHHAAATQDLRQYMQQKYKWTDKIIGTIDFQIGGLAIQKLTPTQQKTTIKLIHEWLPINAHPGRHTSSLYTTNCPLCQQTQETQLHYLSCTVSKDQWDQKILTMLQELQTTPHNPFLLRILKWALLHNRTTNQQYPDPLPNNYAQLINEQHKIGWHHLLKGRWTTQWVQLHDLYHPNQGIIWISTIQKKLWEIHSTIWQQRNDTQHEKTEYNQLQQRNAMETKIKALYTLLPQIDITDRAILPESMEATLQLTTPTLQSIIKTATPHVKQSIQRAKQRTKMSMKTIRSYFSPRENSQQQHYNTLPIGISQQHKVQQKAKNDLKPP